MNFEKSSLEAEHKKTYLGYLISTEGEPTLHVPHARCRKLKKDIERVLRNDYVQARVLARVTGQCVSMFKAISPGKLMLRNTYRVLEQRCTWDDSLYLTQSARADLQWWSKALDGWNGHVFTPSNPDAQIIMDASPVGFGIVCGDLKAAGFWTPRVANKPQNYREMMAILVAVHTFGPRLKDKHVQIVTDNVSAMCYINHLGGPSVELTSLAKDIWMAAQRCNLTLSATFLAGILNVEADGLSRQSTQDEWSLHPRLFQYLDSIWGPHTMDRFANMGNHLIARYNSRFLDPLCSGVDRDALAQTDWHSENNFINAPFRLLPRIIDKIIQTQAYATIIAPAWKGQAWFHTMTRLLISPPVRIPKGHNAILKIIGNRTPEPLRNQKWRLYAWRIYGGNA